MKWLNNSGNVLDEAAPIIDESVQYLGGKRESNAIRRKILKDLLPYQKTVCEDSTHRIVGFVAGYGSGKSRTMAAWLVLLSLDNPNTLGVAFAPTGPLVRDVVIRTMEDFLEEYQIPYSFRVSPLPEFTLFLPEGPVTILCRSMENWNRIIGLNASFIACDEIDTSKIDIAKRAVEKFLGRLRAGKRRQLGLFSTPEGFGILYSMFVEEGHKTDRILFKGRTMDNPYLPPDFLEAMRENYSPAMFRAYTEGEFVNLTQSSVYPEFDRHLNLSLITEFNSIDTIYVGVDFNVGRCLMICLMVKPNGLHVVAEHVARDTPAVIEVLRTHYQQWIDNGQLIVCPDASSQSKSTKDAGISDFGLMRQAGLSIKIQASNPLIRDRVLSVNTLILNAAGDRQLFVNPLCKLAIRGLEQHSYDSKTGQPMKGDGGVDDLSGQNDALGYAIWALRGIKSWKSGTARLRGGTPVRIW